MVYHMEGRVRYSEIGENRKMTLQSLINYFQDCTTFHSEEVGLGMEELTIRQKAWILSAWQIHIRRYPKLGERIRVNTWPYEFKGFYGGRNFTMETAEGELLASANSLWVYMDLKTGRPCRVDEEEARAYPLEPRLEEEFGDRKIVISQEGEAREAFTVKQHHLDTNHHVNNGQYVDMAMEYVPENFEVHSLRVEYKMQAVLGDVLYPRVAKEEERYLIALNNEKGKPYVIVEVME